MTAPFFNEMPSAPFVLPAGAVPWAGWAPEHRGITFERFVFERCFARDPKAPLGSTCWVSTCRRISLLQRGFGRGFIDVQLDGETIHERGFEYLQAAAEFTVDAMLLADELAAIGPV